MTDQINRAALADRIERGEGDLHYGLSKDERELMAGLLRASVIPASPQTPYDVRFHENVLDQLEAKTAIARGEYSDLPPLGDSRPAPGAQPQPGMRQALERILFENFYTGEPGEREAIRTAISAICALTPELQSGMDPIAWITESGLENWLKGDCPEKHVLLRTGGDLRRPLYTLPRKYTIADAWPIFKQWLDDYAEEERTFSRYQDHVILDGIMTAGQRRAIVAALANGQPTSGVSLHWLVDWVHLYATEGHSWISTKSADQLIALAARKPTQADADHFKTGMLSVLAAAPPARSKMAQRAPNTNPHATWQTVPLPATSEMTAAAELVDAEMRRQGFANAEPEAIYYAMLDAAPSPPVQGSSEERGDAS